MKQDGWSKDIAELISLLDLIHNPSLESLAIDALWPIFKDPKSSILDRTRESPASLDTQFVRDGQIPYLQYRIRHC